MEDFQRDGLASQFWSGWSFDATDTPCRQSRYVLIAPPLLTFATCNHGSVPVPSVRDSGGWRIHEWQMTDIPAHPVEVMGTGDIAAGTRLDISTIHSWAQVAKWYAGISAPRCIPDAVVRAKAAELTRTAQTEKEKIHAIGMYVADDIKYQNIPFRLSTFVPAEGREVIRWGAGDSKDKAALLSALLAAIGIKSEIVLLSGRSQGLLTYLPLPRFGNAIVLVQTAQRPLFMDASTPFLSLNVLPSEDQQVQALIISPKTVSLIETPTPLGNLPLSDKIYTKNVNPDGTPHGTCDWSVTGVKAWLLRSIWQRVPEANRKAVALSLTGAVIRDAVFESGTIEDITDPDLPLQFHFVYHTVSGGRAADSALTVPLPWSSETKTKFVAALQSETRRTQDLEALEARGRTHSVAHIQLAGYAPQELPSGMHLTSPFGSFRAHYRVEGSLLTAERDLNLTVSRVPARDVADYAAFLKAVDNETTRQIVLMKLQLSEQSSCADCTGAVLL